MIGKIALRRVLCSAAASFLGISFSIFLVTHLYKKPPITVVRANVITRDLELDHNFQGQWTVSIDDKRCSGVSTRWLQSVDQPDWIEPLSPIEINLDRMVKDTPTLIIYPFTPFDVPESAPIGVMSYHNVTKFSCPILWLFSYTVDVVFPPVTFHVVQHPGK
jgi:hypothetical protein